MKKTVLVTTDGARTTITLNRPDALNALTPEMHDALEAAFDGFAADPDQRVCVITGAGTRAFCAGTDLRNAWDRDMAPTTYPKHGYAGLIERFDLTKPVIAAVNGLALGGGFEVALACDMILADPTATFGLPEPRVGAVALGGGIHRLVRQIGQKQAMGLLLTSRRIDAAEGARLGFVNAVAGDQGLAALVDVVVADIIAGAPLAISATKEAVVRGLEQASIADALARQADNVEWRRWAGSEDLHEGVSAFVEKRSPRWRGI